MGNMKLDIIGGGSTSSGNMKWILLEDSASSEYEIRLILKAFKIY
jgi:hypothetical protein